MSQVDLAALNADAPIWRPPKAGIYIWPAALTTDTFTFNEGESRAFPLAIAGRTPFDQIACEVTGAGTDGAVVRLGIHEDDGSDNPGALVVDAGTVDGTTTGVKTLAIAETLGPGIYWLQAVNQDTSSGSTMAQLRYATSLVTPWLAFSSVDFTSPGSHVVTRTSTGALPDPYTSTTRGNNPPLVALRTA